MASSTNSELERRIETALSNDPGTWTPQCLDEDTLFELSEQGGDHLLAKSHFVHLANCNYCFNEYRALSEIRQLSLQNAPSASYETAFSEKVAISSPRFFNSGAASWLNQINETVVRLKEAVQPRTLSYGFSDQEEKIEKRQSLQFDDPNALGSVSIEDGNLWLKFQHRLWKVGSLVLFEATDEQGKIVWNQFALLYRGFRQATTEIKLENDQVLNYRPLSVAIVEAEKLPEEAGFLLYQSFKADTDLTPAHLSAWQEWAEVALKLSLDAGVREVVANIAGS